MIRALLLAGAVAAATPAAAFDCRGEAAALERREAELPDPAVLPNDRQIVCISLEVHMDFAQRLAALAAACPHQAVAARLAQHRSAAEGHARTFAQRRCKRTMPP